MTDHVKVFQASLEKYSYRSLQQCTKAMDLPSNIKKVYLIQLITTNYYGTERELELLVRHIREEQKQRRALMRKKKMKQKMQEMSSNKQ